MPVMIGRRGVRGRLKNVDWNAPLFTSFGRLENNYSKKENIHLIVALRNMIARLISQLARDRNLSLRSGSEKGAICSRDIDEQ